MKLLETGMNYICKAGKKAVFEVEKESPKILVATGIITGVAALLWMRKAAQQEMVETKLAKDDIKRIHAEAEKDEKGKPKYTPEQNKALQEAYKDVIISDIRIYSGPALMGVLSFTSFLSGFGILNDRFQQASEGLTSMIIANRSIDERARKFLSEDDYRKVIHGDIPEVTEVKTIDEDGNEKVETVTTWKTNVDSKLLYTRYWCRDCDGWLKSGPEYNIMHLKNILADCQRILDRDGILFLSTVLEMLELPVTKCSRIVCWKQNKDYTKRVSFGSDFEKILEGDREWIKAWGTANEFPLRLEFNVDGDTAWQEMPEY